MSEDSALYVLATETTQPTLATCPSCGNRLGKWFGATFVMHHRGRVVRAEGVVSVTCEDCGTQVQLAPLVDETRISAYTLT